MIASLGPREWPGPARPGRGTGVEFPGPPPYRPGFPPPQSVPLGDHPLRPDSLEAAVFDKLLARRTIFLRSVLDWDAGTLVAAQLMALDADGGEPVLLVVNSGGGPIDAATGLLDTMGLVRCPIDTTCLGHADGTAAVVVAAGTGRRRAGPGASFRLRFPDLDASGPASRLREEIERARALQDALIDRVAEITGQSRALVARDAERGRVLGATDAVAYGLIDEVATTV